ncbi:MAG: 3-methyl-2-oxobutanoate hydroxymethyltransferase, partial [Candidatus Micrarchaeia archaeon]
MTPRELKELKGKRRVCALTCYDYSSARVLDRAGVDVLLVGDSLGMVVLGYDDTKSVTMQDMLSHTAAVCRGAQKTLVVGDMPIGTYGSSQKALQNAKCFIDAGAHAVKLEGPVFEQARLLVENKVPVMGHLGLLPQTAKDYKVQGKTQGEGEKILKDAVALEKTGVFAIVLECVPSSLAKKITQTISV